MNDLDKIKVDNSARKNQRLAKMEFLRSHEYGPAFLADYAEGRTAEDTIDALVAEVELRRRLWQEELEYCEVCCERHLCNFHALARSLLKDEEPPVHSTETDK